MKKHLIKIGTFLLFSAPVMAQTTTETTEFKPSGKVDGKVFANFNSTISVPEGEKDFSAFEIKRAYLGYTYNLSPQFSARLLLDIGDDDSFITNTTTNSKSSIARYAYFRNAVLYYTKNKLKLGFGMQETFNTKVQDKVWNKRYVEKTVLDLYKFANTADLGFTAQYNMDLISFDMGIFNGEGYKKAQKDNIYRGSIGATATLLEKKLIIRIADEYEDSGYNTTTKVNDGVKLNTMTFFVGYTTDKFNIGAEVSQQTNYYHIEDADRTGISISGTFNPTSKLSIFARYDNLTSSDEGKTTNKVYDCDLVIAGIEYSVIKNLRCSLNAQNYNPMGSDNTRLLGFLNLEYAF
jgi:hypothetical protein